MSVRTLLEAGRDRYRRLPWPVKRMLYPVRLALDQSFRRRERKRGRAFAAYAACHGAGLAAPLAPARRGDVLVVHSGLSDMIGLELFLLQSLKAAGFRPVVLTDGDPWTVRYYRLAGVDRFLSWNDFAPMPDRAAAAQTLAGCRNLPDLLTQIDGVVRVGKFTVSTGLSTLRLGTLDLADPMVSTVLARHLADSRSIAAAAREIIARVRPKMVLSLDPGYTPRGELFDVCCDAGIPTVTWNVAHKASALIFKRYTADNRAVHPITLSTASWDRLRAIPWTAAHRERVHRELFGNYVSGEWYCEVGTQFNKRMFDADELAGRLGVDPRKKTAVIFAHILWDGTLFYGTDLFANYEEWLLATVRAAVANPAVNWIVKVHPANSVKSARAGLDEVPGEMLAIRHRIGPLPEHVRVLPHTTDISTYSLFRMMDYCLTVRGTVGMEASLFGVPVLTAGTGRYDRLGFTLDSDTAAEYLARLARIQEIPRQGPEQIERAERFAYGILLARPLDLQTVSCRFAKDATASLRVETNAVTAADWQNAGDLQALARWLGEEAGEDFLNPLE